MGENKRALLSKQVRLRIRVLAIQSYALLVLMAVLIFYGFAISSKAVETTNSDLQDVRQSAERVRILSELQQQRFHMIDYFVQLDKLFIRAQEQLGKAIANAIKPGADKLDYNDAIYFEIYVFRTDFSYSLRQLESAEPHTLVTVDPPPDCLNVLKLPMKRSKDKYFLFEGSDFLPDYSNYVQKLSFAIVRSNKGLEETERAKDVAKKAIALALPGLCKNINNSVESEQISIAVTQIDRLLDQQDAIDGRDGKNAAASSSSGTRVQDAGAVALLLANRFGPLIIIFFFSSLIITLYKYNSRLVSFYYARFYALEASELSVYKPEFASAVKVFSPDGVDFGRAPRTPVDVAGDIATKIVEKIDILKDEKSKPAKEG